MALNNQQKASSVQTLGQFVLAPPIHSSRSTLSTGDKQHTLHLFASSASPEPGSAFGFGIAGCGCCDEGCPFFSDSFTRADSDNPGSDYSEVSGDWDIASNKLSTSSSSGVLGGTMTHPLSEPNISITASVTIEHSGDTARLILNYTDSSNFWFAEAKAASSGAYLRIYEKAGGSDTQKASLAIIQLHNQPFTLCASITGSSRFEARVGRYFVSYDGSFSQPSWGIGTGALTGTVTFDDLVVGVTGNTCPGCGQSCASCSSGEGPAQLKVVIPAGTYEHQTSGSSGCEDTECSMAEGTYYLEPVWSVNSQVVSLGTFDGGHVTSSAQCAYGLCVETHCVATGHAVLRAIMAMIDSLLVGSVICTRTRVVLSNNEHFIYTDDDSDPDTHQCDYDFVNLTEARYSKTYSGLVDCSAWQDESIPFLSRQVAVGEKLCVPTTTSTVEVTAVG